MSVGTHIAILGPGPGRYVAAMTVIEAQAHGGVCLNWGCILSKALLAVVELGEKVKKAGSMGLEVSGPVTYNLSQMVERKHQVVAGLVKGWKFKSYWFPSVVGSTAAVSGLNRSASGRVREEKFSSTNKWKRRPPVFMQSAMLRGNPCSPMLHRLKGWPRWKISWAIGQPFAMR